MRDTITKIAQIYKVDKFHIITKLVLSEE